MEESLDYVHTKDDLLYTLDALDFMRKELYRNKEEKADTYIPVWLEEELSRKSDSHEKENYIGELEKYLKSLPIAKFTLSYSPDRKMVEAISGWVRKNVREGLILDLIEDPTILGGFTLSLYGKYVDMSLSRRIDEWFGERMSEYQVKIQQPRKKSKTMLAR